MSQRIFLCHASEDKDAVRSFYAKLEDAGFEPWLDEEDLLPGQIWEDEIPRAIRESGVVLVFLSKASVSKRGYVQREFRAAFPLRERRTPQFAPPTSLVARVYDRPRCSRLGRPLTPATACTSAGYPNSRTLRSARKVCLTTLDGEGRSGRQRDLVCRYCGCSHFRVIYTRPAWGGRIMRGRECRYCGRRMTTTEKALC